MKQGSAQEAASTLAFSAKAPDAEPTGAASMVLHLPKDLLDQMPRGAKTVEGIINAFPFRAAIEPGPNGGHALRVSQAVQQAAGVRPGETVAVEITRFNDETELRTPPDFAAALAGDPIAATNWKSITPNARRDWILSVTTAKLPETRQRRIEKAIDMLTKGKRRLCCFPGLNWMTKDYPDAETWLPLPPAKAKI